MAPRGLVVGMNINESRTRNFVEELRRRGYEVDEFRITRAGEFLRAAGRLIRALARAEFVLMGPVLPWGIALSYLPRLLGVPVLLDCPMDIAEWPFAPSARSRRMVRVLLRSACRVLTLETRAYFREKFRLREGSLVCVESCPDEVAIAEAAQVRARFAIEPAAFVVCCSGGALQHRLERFLPIFERLAGLVPEAILLVVADPAHPLSIGAQELAKNNNLANRIIVSSVIRPLPEFLGTLARVDLWIATLGDDTLQGDREFRMELLEVAHLGKAVAAAPTGALLHHGLEDGQTLIFFDPKDTETAASKLAHLARSPGHLRAIGERLRIMARRRFRLDEAVDRILESLPGDRSRRPQRQSGGRP